MFSNIEATWKKCLLRALQFNYAGEGCANIRYFLSFFLSNVSFAWCNLIKSSLRR